MYFLVTKYVKTYKNDPTAEEEGPQKQEKPIKVIEQLVVHRVAQSARAPYIYALLLQAAATQDALMTTTSCTPHGQQALLLPTICSVLLQLLQVLSAPARPSIVCSTCRCCPGHNIAAAQGTLSAGVRG